jgi:hypothetical protein
MKAELDPTLGGRIVARTPLLYPDGASGDDDRPAFVRAASGLAPWGDELAIVQDDASFLAFYSAARGLRSLPLPRGARGRRRFEEALGNRLDKPDLESIVTVPTRLGPRLLAFGSGSLPLREIVAVIDPTAGSAEFIGAMAFCQAVRDALELGPSELNIEGAALVNSRLRFFQRRPGKTVDVDAAAFVDWLLDPGESPVPRLFDVFSYDLGLINGVPYGFTDAAAQGAERVLFCASAEDTDDPVYDGAVAGSLIGVIEPGRIRVAPLCDADGRPLALKAEGIALDPSRSDRVWLVNDADDPLVPAELCTVEISL